LPFLFYAGREEHSWAKKHKEGYGNARFVFCRKKQFFLIGQKEGMEDNKQVCRGMMWK
jgi:hypothetical protein